MIFTTIIILIVSLIIVAIVVNAVQQRREQIEAEKRTEIAKQKSIVEETEGALLTTTQIPITNRVVYILNQRIFNALKQILDLNPGAVDTRQRMRDTQSIMESIDVDAPPPSYDGFTLPDNDKMVIQYIQAIKRFRVLLRSEHNKGKVDSHTYMAEDKRLEHLQLRVNVETLARRGNAAMQTNMLGSARQYFEKALAAMQAQPELDDYLLNLNSEVSQKLMSIQDNLRNANQQDREKKKEQERDELDELFAPKKKW